ncbi:MAG TPA: antibiotic biosynthesis monooxygenase [Dehalococcoidia bacterium]|nr:antibiotic biosynthesis monooxygenase [Dehalococcoidia bacterium]
MTEAGFDVVTLVVTMTIKPEQETTFLQSCREFVEWVHANEPDTLLYVLTKHSSREHTYVWVERYRNEAAVEAHRTSPRMTEVLIVVRECLDGAPEVQRLQQVIPA